MTREEALRAMSLCDSQERAACLLRIADDLSDADLKHVLTEFWTIMEAWGGSEDRHEMLELLHRVGYITDTKKKPKLDRAYPGYGLVKIYRGTSGADPTEGFCWTTSEATAEFFAKSAFTLRGKFLGLGRTGQFGALKEGSRLVVWYGWVRRDDILGYFEGRGESEVIVDPADIIQYDWLKRSDVIEDD